MEASPGIMRINAVYFACLLDWKDQLVGAKQEQFKASILSAKNVTDLGVPSDDPNKGKSWPDWQTASLKCTALKSASDALVLVTHSRLIIKFSLRSEIDFNSLKGIREARDELLEVVKNYLRIVQSEMAKTISFSEDQGPRIFFYAIFEMSSGFWRNDSLEGPQPATLSTTCFYTRLPDLGKRYVVKPRELRMRISGAMIVTEKMSSWFFWNLSNAVFHQGLYRQERQESINDRYKMPGVYYGLENRLEVFADHVTNSFYQLLSAKMSARLNQLILYVTIGLAVIGLLASNWGAFISIIGSIISRL